VDNGFPSEVELASLDNRAEYDTKMLQTNLMFGTPDQIIDKLRRYEALDVDNFIYYATYGLPMAQQHKSLKLFVEEVMPAFADKSPQRALADAN
jgi:alkanesulfonate monooxygenase SsuD/methylene tetrahydromethanopterin reductase-like flavin-dependent oxidoreductase (luciferase family)